MPLEQSEKGMKFNMKINFKKIIIILLCILTVILAVFFIRKTKNEKSNYEEIEPEQEILEKQERQTIVSLYFINKNTRSLEPEARLIDVKDLVENPYGELINLLLGESKNDNLESAIPSGTILLGAEMSGNTLVINFSEEFINNHKGGKEEEEKTIESLVNTLTELTEVNEIKILINGEENREFKDKEVNFQNVFLRND